MGPVRVVWFTRGTVLHLAGEWQHGQGDGWCSHLGPVKATDEWGRLERLDYGDRPLGVFVNASWLGMPDVPELPVCARCKTRFEYWTAYIRQQIAVRDLLAEAGRFDE